MRKFLNNTGVFKSVIIFVALIWIVHLINFTMGYKLNGMLGLGTRQASGLDGILFCPFLHADFGHIIVNTAPLLLLGGAILSVNAKRFWAATAIIILVGGALTWGLARPNTLHVGASGVVFGYFGFLIAHGIRVRSLPAIAGALVAILLYGAMWRGIFPSGPGISWEGHLFGLIAGVLAALILPRPDPMPSKFEGEEDEGDESYKYGNPY